MDAMKKIVDYVLCSEGFYFPDYYQGFGTGPGIPQENAILGAGTTEKEAFEDALEQLAQMGWDVSAIEADEEAETLSDEQDPDEQGEEQGRMYYFGIRWNEPDGKRTYYAGHGFYLTMTYDQACSGSHRGSCADDVMQLSKVPEIAEQLAALSPEDVRAEIRDYGAWEKQELADDAENLQRLLWLACGQIQDEEKGDK